MVWTSFPLTIVPSIFHASPFQHIKEPDFSSINGWTTILSPRRARTVEAKTRCHGFLSEFRGEQPEGTDTVFWLILTLSGPRRRSKSNNRSFGGLWSLCEQEKNMPHIIMCWYFQIQYLCEFVLLTNSGFMLVQWYEHRVKSCSCEFVASIHQYEDQNTDHKRAPGAKISINIQYSIECASLSVNYSFRMSKKIYWTEFMATISPLLIPLRKIL